MTIDMTFERRIELTKRDAYNDGIELGKNQGTIVTLLKSIIKKVKRNKQLSTIADELEESVETIRPLYNAVVENPDKSADEIYDILQK